MTFICVSSAVVQHICDFDNIGGSQHILSLNRCKDQLTYTQVVLHTLYYIIRVVQIQ